MEAFICRQCPRNCGVRRDVRAGYCGVGMLPRIARLAAHFDEEPCISGVRGSGAVFLSGCALKCVYCQNEPISHGCFGQDMEIPALKDALTHLIGEGVHNINFVNPTHYAHMIDQLLAEPLPVPVVWNSSGYEKVETLERFQGRVQVYLPDLKYVDSGSASRYSSAPDYFEYAAKALVAMHRQVGNPQLDSEGIIQRGLIVRHLILPGRASESMRVLDWIKAHLPGAWISLMAQYVPFGKALTMPELNRQITQAEYDQVYEHMLALGLEDGYVQALSSADEQYIPAFDLTGLRG